MSKTLKVGDWAMLGTDTVQVKEVRGGNSYDVSTGFIATSGQLGDRLYPLTLKNKATAECAESYCREMREMCRSVNWPDIASRLEYQLATSSENEKAQAAVLDRLRIIRDQLREIHRMEFNGLGFGVFRR